MKRLLEIAFFSCLMVATPPTNAGASTDNMQGWTYPLVHQVDPTSPTPDPTRATNPGLERKRQGDDQVLQHQRPAGNASTYGTVGRPNHDGHLCVEECCIFTKSEHSPVVRIRTGNERQHRVVLRSADDRNGPSDAARPRQPRLRPRLRLPHDGPRHR